MKPAKAKPTKTKRVPPPGRKLSKQEANEYAITAFAGALKMLAEKK